MEAECAAAEGMDRETLRLARVDRLTGAIGRAGPELGSPAINSCAPPSPTEPQ
jgi:hypothetical protein